MNINRTQVILMYHIEDIKNNSYIPFKHTAGVNINNNCSKPTIKIQRLEFSGYWQLVLHA